MSLKINNIRDHITDSTDSVRDAAKLLERICKHHPQYSEMFTDSIRELRASEKNLRHKLAAFDAVPLAQPPSQQVGNALCQ